MVRELGRNGMRIAGILLMAVLAPLSSAQAQPEPEMVTILAVRDAGGWRIDVEIEGIGLTSASFTPPGQPALVVACESGPGEVLCERIEPAPPAAGAPTLAALLTQFPAGNWLVSVDGGVLSATVPFAPVEPDGVVTVTDPANGATNVSPTPDVSYQNACSSCTFLEFRIEDAATLGTVFEIDAFLSGAAPLPSGLLDFEAFDEGTAPPLPDGEYQLMAAAIDGALEARSFDQGGAFDFGAGASLQTRTSFRVPEPGAAALAAAAAAALTGLQRSRAR
jgi:hypothetical protein